MEDYQLELIYVKTRERTDCDDKLCYYPDVNKSCEEDVLLAYY